jgi:hypothetical protein
VTIGKREKRRPVGTGRVPAGVLAEGDFAVDQGRLDRRELPGAEAFLAGQFVNRGKQISHFTIQKINDPIRYTATPNRPVHSSRPTTAKRSRFSGSFIVRNDSPFCDRVH